jgi:hypothetical protein
MKKLLSTFALLLLAFELLAGGSDVSVRGYSRSNGTYVAPHMRSAPDGNFYNNWSTKGNLNPYTGVPGTRLTPSHNFTGGYLATPSAMKSDTRLKVGNSQNLKSLGARR